VLNGRLALFDVLDVELLANRALDDQLRSMSAELNELDREDALAFLIEKVWDASRRFDPERGWSFSTYGYRLCRRRTIDWYRRHYGRTRWTFSSGYEYERERPTVLSLEASADSGGGELDGAFGYLAGELEAGRLDLERALRG
jgi:DNA-directed RNA polymerase specialized sigma24 family protein